MKLRYHSPEFQLLLIALCVIFTHAIHRLVETYLLQSTPLNDNPLYDTYWPTSLIACVSGFVSIFAVNILGLRVIFFSHSISSILYAASVVVGYQYKHYTFHTAAFIILNCTFNITRVATIVAVLTYSSERWKSRALGTYLFIEYLSATMSNIIAIRHPNDSNSLRLHVSIAILSLTCLAPLFAAALAPTNKIVRNNGVYLIARESNIKTEIKETAYIFRNKYMLLLLPYMFSYSFLYSVCNVPLHNVLGIILYDLGKLFILALGQMLDVPWSTRRIRGYVGFATLLLFFGLSTIFTVTARLYDNGWDLTDPNWSHNQITNFLTENSLKIHRSVVLTSYFFSGVASSMIELFGFWVIGTLTNDIRACGRFVGTSHSVMSIGGMVGVQIISNVPFNYMSLNIPMFVGLGITVASFCALYFVLRRITDTNDWTLGKISNNNDSRCEIGTSTSSHSSNTYFVITDVKHVHSESEHPA
ncbi:hypothetical protein LPJ72_003872 [Coemansia sp. Benny D160-2]|nr:hypothetical protein LPJ72_003872 [Coemansia sp. Benny D160-2]